MTARIFTILLLSLILFLPWTSFAQSPFQAPPEQPEEKKEHRFQPGDLVPEWIKEKGQATLARIMAWQHQIRQKAAAYARQIREDPWGSAFWSYLGLAFAYGVVHALGPGHGKAFVGTYFLSRKASVKQGLMVGSVMSFLHVLSAIILVMGVYFIFKTGGMGPLDQAEARMQKISAGLIFLVGLFLAWKSGRAMLHGSAGGCGCCSTRADNKSLLSLALAVGLVPCPGAALILFFSITLDIMFAGLVAMVFLAAGLTLVTASFALAALFARNLLAKVTTAGSIISPRLYHLPAMIGAVLISLLGIALYFNPIL